MNTGRRIAVVLVIAGMLMGSALAQAKKSSAGASDGKTLFEGNCSSCHPNGGNIINPQKTLKRASLKAHNINSGKDIVKIMRNPGPGMTRFDENTIPDKDAKKIADYILKTFK
jgi:cytochrome c6